MESHVYAFESPNFHTKKGSRGVDLAATLLNNCLNFRRYTRSLSFLDRWIKEVQPDAIVNFYDFLAGIYMLMNKPQLPYFVIGHQYLAYHPDFIFAPGMLSSFLFRCCNRITSFRSQSLLALSYSPYPEGSGAKLRVLPPLLRKEVFQLATRNEGFLLAYVVNSGYGEDILRWHRSNSEAEMHCFWDNPLYPDVWSPHEHLTFHPIDDKKFLHYLSSCRAYISTAGFESICEALFLGKPIMAVPVEGQYEQACNALDASKLAQVMSSDEYDISRFLSFVEDFYARPQEYGALQAWYRKGGQLLVDTLVNGVISHAHAQHQEDLPILLPEA
jgi:uncharacterized protein (TIGR00661 family)